MADNIFLSSLKREIFTQTNKKISVTGSERYAKYTRHMPLCGEGKRSEECLFSLHRSGVLNLAYCFQRL